MRGMRTKEYKYIRNLVPEIEFPFASDLWACQTWQSLEERRRPTCKRTIQAYLHRPGEELYDVREDPDEVVNLRTHQRINNVGPHARRSPWLASQEGALGRSWGLTKAKSRAIV